jgi:hypothetical protein
MAADTITVPRETAFETAAFLEAIVHTLGDLGADTNALMDLQRRAYDPIASELERENTFEQNEELVARGHEIAERMSSLVDLNLARRVAVLERNRDELALRLSVLEEKFGWKQADDAS